MPFDRDKLFEQFKEMGANAKQPTCPDVLNVEELEDAFKCPECNDRGEANPIPVIWKNYGYGQDIDGVCILSVRSASIVSSSYYILNTLMGVPLYGTATKKSFSYMSQTLRIPKWLSRAAHGFLPRS